MKKEVGQTNRFRERPRDVDADAPDESRNRFWSFKTFAAAVELDLFTKLHSGRTLTVAQAEAELGLPERPADLLLAACASLGFAGEGRRRLSQQPAGRGVSRARQAVLFRRSGFLLRPAYVSSLAPDRRGAAHGPGNFLTDTHLPDGHDVVLFSMILHDWDQATNRELLAKAYEALLPGGLVVVSELLLNAERTGPAPAALMGLNMLVETEGGRNYSDAEYGQRLTGAGFTEVRTVPFDAPGANGAVIAVKPDGV
ncbi:hypothetical protein BKA14_001299 [Actinoplanes abujensis]|uniref:O-methyltransferase n=1 Tax=Paractinoplanes abujensis TaxID=882441 RepID=A0A7W7G205_9ACTN|nr:hypothetical protein [Actinoplanes abujensis]